MSANTSIEWAHHTFNPWWGCTRVSEGCRRCYAETFARRFGVLWGPAAGRRMATETYWEEPRKWNRDAEKKKTRYRVFCASMADVFEDRPELVEPRARLCSLIEETRYLDWMLLTKRPENAQPLVPSTWRTSMPPNVWLGTTVESAEVAHRAAHLYDLSAAVRFLSIEPILGAVVAALRAVPIGDERVDVFTGAGVGPDGTPSRRVPIDWFIAGGESNAGARPCHPAWITELQAAAETANRPFLFKQWGHYVPEDERRPKPAPNKKKKRLRIAPRVHTWDDGVVMIGCGKHAAGNYLAGKQYLGFPKQSRLFAA